jgi:toxin ParE1/3/4
MTPAYQVLPAADADLDHQAEYLAREASLETALRFYNAARTTFEKIAQNPGIGQKRDTLNPHLTGLRVSRIEGFENHLVFYRPGDDGVEIIRVLHGARDIDSILDED